MAAVELQDPPSEEIREEVVCRPLGDALRATDVEGRGSLRCRFVRKGTAGATEQVMEVPAVYNEEANVARCEVRGVPAPEVSLVTAEGDVLPCEPLLKGSAGTPNETRSDPPKKLTQREYVQQQYKALKPFVIISSSYLLFTMTDGAVRLIVLLHAFEKKFSAWEVAIMFTLYELAGVFTNLLAGVAGASWGIRNTLVSGLFLQLGGLGMLFGWKDSFSKTQSIVYVTLAQMLCGIAKDLTKLGGKTVTKLVTPEEKQSYLFKLVSFITGFKNSLKGVGYFIGAAFLLISYEVALAVQCFLILLALPWAITGLNSQLGRTSKKNIKLSDVFKKNFNVNTLSLARYFLFGSRDMWFEVTLPFFLRSASGFGWGRPQVGAYLAVWIIIYGQMQSWTPQLVLKPLQQSPPNKYVCAFWAVLLTACPLFLGCFIQFSSIFSEHQKGGVIGVVTAGVLLFALIFAVNSSVHSYLIVKYSEGNKVAMNVGFYYMANSLGRLTGTLVSGALYSYVGSVRAGFAACFWASLGFAVVSAVVPLFLKDDEGGFKLGPCLQVNPGR